MSMQRVLLIAFCNSQMSGSSGLQSTHHFSPYLGEFEWQAAVRSISKRAYTATSTSGAALGEVEICRDFAIDRASQPSLFGRHADFGLHPDRWGNWWLGSVFMGQKLLSRFCSDVHSSTYLILTAHFVGRGLARWSVLPGVADFSVLVEHDGSPEEAATWQSSHFVKKSNLGGHSGKLHFSGRAGVLSTALAGKAEAISSN